jgi:pSer/pThr/pTyr-binding forkhead associated (FHA) protein
MAKLHHPHAGLLIIRKQNQTMVPLTKDVTTIGRKQADIILDDGKMSSTHAEIRRTGNKFFIKDLKSTNGTYLNRKPISSAPLMDQDVVELGRTTLCFYEDTRDYHGANADAEIPTPRRKTEIEVTNTQEMMTTTKTLQQVPIKLQILQGPDEGKRFSFRKSHILIGRKGADVALLDVDISRAHAMVEVLGGASIFLRDLESTNGTFLNGRKVQVERLKPGDEIGVGNTKIALSLE